MELSQILQALTIVVLVWFGNRVVTVSEKVAVHDEKLNAHNERINKIENNRTR